MLKISSVRARLGKSVTAKIKNEKDDQTRVMEFKLSELGLTQRQLRDLVPCSEHERGFDEVAFVSTDAMSELRHFKKIALYTEVQFATMTIDKLGNAKSTIKLTPCTLKDVALSFDGNERCEMACKVWADLDEHALYLLGAYGGSDVFVAIDAPKHGEREPGPNKEMQV